MEKNEMVSSCFPPVHPRLGPPPDVGFWNVDTPKPGGRNPLKIAFVGFWEVTSGMAPVDDPTWRIWGCNHGWPHLPKMADGTTRWDAWFDLHDPVWSATHMNPVPAISAKVWAEQDAFLRTDHGRPIYMQKKYPEYPNSVAFPLKEIEGLFPVTVNRAFRRYNTNALTYVISLALMQGVTDLAIYGADMRGNEEYAAQRPAVEYWLGVATGMGVKVTIPEASGLLNADGMDYGYEEGGNMLVEIRRALMVDLEKAELEFAKSEATSATYNGLMQGYRDIIQRIDARRRGGGTF
jgi:hypothetical protein